MFNRANTIFLFDVDGTLTPSRGKITPEIREMLNNLREKVFIGFVGGSDLQKQQEQMGEDCLEWFDFAFPENGVCFYEGARLISHERLIDVLGEENYMNFVNFSLRYMSKIDTIPVKRGTFVEFRDSMINLSPIGRSCSTEERKKFKEIDSRLKIREEMKLALEREFDSIGLQFSIGGEISIDCFPKGWDKRYCLKHLAARGINNVYFFGDMVHPGGNDYEIYEDARVHGTKVTSPDDTILKVRALINKIGI